MHQTPVILQVLPALNAGGVERGTLEIAKAIVDQGWKALVVSSGGQMVHELERCGAEHITMPVDCKKPLVIFKNAKRLAKLIQDRGVDIVHARSRAPAWAAFRATQKTNCRFITTFHGTYNFENNLKRWYNSVMTRGDRVIAISSFIVEHICQNYTIDPSKIRLIPRGVDIARFDPYKTSPERMINLARKWRLPDGVPVIMLPGRLTRWKGQEVLLDALSMMHNRNFKCLFVGSAEGKDSYKQELEKKIKRLGLEEQVIIQDHCNDMPTAYMLADVVVSASTDPEAFGRVAAEGQAMGRMVVATDHGGSRETIIPGKTGWLVHPGDPGGLARSLDELLVLPEEQRMRVADAAIKHVWENFTKDLMCARTMAVYEEVLGLASSQQDAA